MTEPFRNAKREWMNGEGEDAVPAKKVPQARPRKIKPKSALGRDSRCVRVDSMMRKMQLDEALSDKAEEYWSVVLNFLRAKLSKRELDAFVLRVLGTANVWLHNEFFFAVLHNANCAEPPPKGVPNKTSAVKKLDDSSKRKKVEATKGVKLEPKGEDFSEPKDALGLKRFRHYPMQYWKSPAQFLRSLKRLGVSSSLIMEEGHLARDPMLSPAVFPYCSTSLPDKSEVHARLLMAAREQGMVAVAEDAAELVLSACELYLRELLTNLLSFVQPNRPSRPVLPEEPEPPPEPEEPRPAGLFAPPSPPSSPVEPPPDSPELVSCPLFSLHPLCSSTPPRAPPPELSLREEPPAASSPKKPASPALLPSAPTDAALLSLLNSSTSSPSLLFLLSSAASSWNNPSSLASFSSTLMNSSSSPLSLLSLLSASLPADPSLGLKDGSWPLPFPESPAEPVSPFPAPSPSTSSQLKPKPPRSSPPPWASLLDTSYTEPRDLRGERDPKYHVTTQDLLGALQVSPEFVREMPMVIDKLIAQT